MRYLGSKAATADAILQLVSSRIPSGSFCDPFGGIGVVGSRFKENGYRVTSGDVLKNAYNFQVARIERNRRPAFRRLRGSHGLNGFRDVMRQLNQAVEYGGWFEREYAIKRKFFTSVNARRIGGCRRLIREWSRNGLLTTSERAVLLASLVDSMDKVANTAGTYYAYLKQWYRKALRPFQFQLLAPAPGASRCRAHHCSAEKLVSEHQFDVLYLDPPYNDRCYEGYYHLPETLAIERTPRLNGRAGVPIRQSLRSPFNSAATALSAFTTLISKASFKLLVFHYADDGLICRKDIQCLLRHFGSVSEQTLSARGYSTHQGRRFIRQRVYLVQHG
jgi:adenine-specific DNA-methyltransferase